MKSIKDWLMSDMSEEEKLPCVKCGKSIFRPKGTLPDSVLCSDCEIVHQLSQRENTPTGSANASVTVSTVASSVPTGTEPLQLPFSGLVIAADESPICGIEVPFLFEDRAMIILTDKNIHHVPLPSFKFGFGAMNSISANFFPLSELTDATIDKSTKLSFHLHFGLHRSISVPKSQAEQFFSMLNPILALYCGKSLVKHDENYWGVQSVSLGEGQQQTYQEQISNLKRELMDKYTNPDFVRQTKSRNITTTLFNTAMGIGFLVCMILLSMKECSQR